MTPVDKAKNLGPIFDGFLSLNKYKHIAHISKKCNVAQCDLRTMGSRHSVELKIQLVHSGI